MTFPLGNARVPAGSPPGVPSIVLACFGRSTASRALVAAARTVGQVSVIDDRRRLLQRFGRIGDLVVLPVVGADGLPTSPIVDRLAAHEKPIIVCRLSACDTVGLVVAVRAGATILHRPTGADLVAACRDGLRAPSMSVTERRALEATLAGLEPSGLRTVLILATQSAHHGLSVARLSELAGVSPRTLNRWTSDARWPSPQELIAWSRLLRAGIAQWHGVRAATLLARASGFTNASALFEASARFIDPSIHVDSLTPLRVSRALRRQLALS
jgi:transcriptional regulator with XRE-family HTH domain